MSINCRSRGKVLWFLGSLLAAAGGLVSCEWETSPSAAPPISVTPPTLVQEQPTRIDSEEKQAATEEPPLGETPPLDPNSAEYPTRVTPQEKEVAKALSGETVHLMFQLSIAEAPDYDPFQDLGKIKLAWRQTAGPPVEILDATSSRARAVMPNVDALTELVFVLEASNSSGVRQVELTVAVHPSVAR